MGLFTIVTFLAGLWLLFTNGAMASWLVGLPAISCAAWAYTRLNTSVSIRISTIGLAYFVPFFLWESLRGGADVAFRTLAPRMRVHPAFRSYRTGLKTVSARTFFTYCVSLLPGTLAADLHDEWLEIHLLNSESDPSAELAKLELAVARLFSENGEIG